MTAVKQESRKGMSYYVIGSKYEVEEGVYENMLPLMLRQNVVSVGFCSEVDLSFLLGNTHSEVTEYLKNIGESRNSYTALKHFLNLKPGDIIAVKIHGSPSREQARVLIGAYAVVKGKSVPNYNLCSQLGHTIEVEFIDSELNYLINASLAQTMHRIETRDKIDQIFGAYAAVDNSKLRVPEYLYSSQLKNINEQNVSFDAAYIREQVHNRIQNVLIEKLIQEYGIEKVKVETDYIDVLVVLEDKLIIHEVKSSNSSEKCIREALGQILSYGHKKIEEANIEYVVVGTGHLDQSKKSFYSYVRSFVGSSFSYRQILL